MAYLRDTTAVPSSPTTPGCWPRSPTIRAPVSVTSPRDAGFTERAVQKIISDLEQNGYLTHTRQGRSNLYRIEEGTILRHPADAGLTVAGLLAALAQQENSHETQPGQGARHQGSDG